MVLSARSVPFFPQRRDVLASVRAQQRAQLDGAVRHVLDACAQRTAAESQDQTAVLDALIFKHMGISPPPQGPTDKEGPPDATCTADDGTDAGVKADTELPSEAVSAGGCGSGVASWRLCLGSATSAMVLRGAVVMQPGGQ